MNIGAGPATDCEQLFRRMLTTMVTEERPPHVLELGTRRWDPDFPTHHQEWAPSGVRWTMADAMTGDDVDEIADAHDLCRVWLPGSFDAYVAVSLFEHLERPWIAAASAAEVLRPGGWLYVATHQTFPLHGYPRDYFRFSREALAVIFADAGFDQIHTGYRYRCTIEPPPEVTRWNRAPDVESWLNVEITARRA
jgi:SAM-dependent methyltransferase